MCTIRGILPVGRREDIQCREAMMRPKFGLWLTRSGSRKGVRADASMSTVAVKLVNQVANIVLAKNPWNITTMMLLLEATCFVPVVLIAI